MIRKVWLRNWKAYDSLELNFGAGTTFLVAENGIGKSSIVQGIYFALFGSQYMFGTDRPASNAVRGADDATAVAGCEISLGSRLIRLERMVTKSSSSTHVAKIHIDGSPASEDDWLELLQSETGVDAAQLALLAFVPEGATMSLQDAGLTTVQLLSEVFGVGRLRRAATECEVTAKRLDRETDNLRKSLRDSPSKHDAKQLIELDAQLAHMAGQLQELKKQQSTLRHHEAVRLEWARYESDKLSFQQAADNDRRQISELDRKIRDLIEPSSPAGEGAAVRRDFVVVVDSLSERCEQLIADRGRLEGERSAALRHKSILSGESPLCPTCRQPLSRDAADNAMAEHQGVIDESSAAIAIIDSDLRQIRQLIAEGRMLIGSPEPKQPAQPGERLPESVALAAIDVSSLESQISELERAIADKKAEVMAIRRIDEKRKQNDLLSARLLEAYRAAERARMLAATMTRLADAICADRIAPMSDELQKRWLTLSSDSKLYMDATGMLSLEEGGYVIPYCNLSGGQRTLAQLAVRLLALQMATRCPFFVLDEPLEHLDPKNRRSLATLLVHATHRSSQLRQVLVTTYEESVTRRLSSVPGHFVDAEEVGTASTARVVRIAATDRSSLG